MKITLTGSLGNITKPLAKQLIAAGHQVTIISSSADKIVAIEALGAIAAIGSIADVDFLIQAFTGADAVYTMVPPNFGTTNYRKYVSDFTKNYAEAIKKAGITKVVNLTSIGAHVDGGTGQISGNHDGEIVLNGLDGVAIKHIRAGFFYVNFFANVDMIKHTGFIGANYGSNTRMIMVHPEDIAATVAEELQTPFSGKTVRYITSDDRTTGEIATALGTAIGKPDMQWVEFTDEQTLGGMIQAGVPEYIAQNFIEMNTALRNGILWTDYDAKGNKPTGKIKLEDFAKEFAEKF